MVEHRTCNAGVASSTLASGSRTSQRETKAPGLILVSSPTEQFAKNTVVKGEPFFNLDYARLYTALFIDRDVLKVDAPGGHIAI